MSMSNKDAVEAIKELKEFCDNKKCSLCCFAGDTDDHCLLADNILCELETEIFEKRAKELIE